MSADRTVRYDVGVAIAAFLLLGGLLILSMLPRHTASLFGEFRWLAFPVGGGVVLVSAGLATVSVWRLASGSGFGFGLRMFAIVSGAVCLALAILLGGSLAMAYTCCPGYYGLAAYFGLLIVAGLAFFVAVVFVPIAFGVLFRSPSRKVVRNSTLAGLTAGLLPAVISLATAPHYYQDIGNWISGAGSALTVGLIATGIVVLCFGSWATRLSFPLLPVAIATVLFASGITFQTVVAPPDNPALTVRSASQSITLIAPAGHNEVLAEVYLYQTAYGLLADRAGLPVTSDTFVIAFDSASTRSVAVADGQWPLSMSLADTPAQRLERFRHAAAGALTYDYGQPSYQPYAAFELWLLDQPARPLSAVCQDSVTEAPFALAEKTGGVTAAQKLMRQLSPGGLDPERQPFTDAQWLARAQATCASSR